MKVWMLGGAIGIAILASLMLVTPAASPFIPIPALLVLLAWSISYGFIFVLPIIYLVELRLIGNNNGLGKIVLSKAVILTILSTGYYWLTWADGLRFQGAFHVKAVAVENFISLTVLLALAITGCRNQSKSLQLSANLLFFALLSWSAFPYFGELP